MAHEIIRPHITQKDYEDEIFYWKDMYEREKQNNYIEDSLKECRMKIKDLKSFENSLVEDEPEDKKMTLDRVIEEEVLKAHFCGWIPDAETEGLRQFNVFNYAYRLGMKHSENYPDVKE